MHLVDSSIWIHALRPAGNAEIQARLKPLIIEGQTAVTEWILLELMTGLVKSQQPSTLLQWFAPVPRLPFNPEWWETAWDLAGSLRRHVVPLLRKTLPLLASPYKGEELKGDEVS